MNLKNKEQYLKNLDIQDQIVNEFKDSHLNHLVDIMYDFYLSLLVIY